MALYNGPVALAPGGRSKLNFIPYLLKIHTKSRKPRIQCCFNAIHDSSKAAHSTGYYTTLNFELVQSQCLGSQRSLLLKLKHEFNATSGGYKIKSWDVTSRDCCKWSGVTCTGGYVTGLDLSREGIAVDNTRFNDSSALFALRNLSTLNLAENSFDTTIPSAIVKLEKLINLNLSNAGFTGQVPIEISTLTRLVTLDISPKSFLGIKVDNPNLRMLFGNLSNLEELRLRYADLSTQSSDWCQALSSSLPRLRVLDLTYSELTGPIDPSLQNLTSLSSIDLYKNTFSAPFPKFLASLRNLTYLNLADCGLTGKVPGKIFQMPKLRFLALSHNFVLQGDFPKVIKNSSLETLLLQNTDVWKTIPDSIGQLKMLSRLNLLQCGLVGQIPKSISQLTNLVSVEMSSNDLNGSIPSFSQAKNLEVLDLRNNDLTGSLLSTDWKQLTSLKTIFLQGNSISGNIPTSFFGLPSLITVSFSGNPFTGFTKESIIPSSQLQNLYLSSNNLREFPSVIIGLHGLQALDLSSNNFGTTLHLNSLSQLKNLTYLDLSNSNLVVETDNETALFPQLTYLGLTSCGLKEIPIFLKNHNVIDNLDLSENQIPGLIPSWTWDISTLAALDLSHNRLEGLEKTSSILKLNITYLILSDNLLQGELPDLASVTDLNLSSNRFNFSIPYISSRLGPKLSFLDLSKNNLYGNIPESICTTIPKLYQLDLSENFLSGSIPDCLLNLLSIGSIKMRKNNLSSISDTVESNCGLRTIDLSSNALQGNLPKSLANCSQLDSLDLSNNKFENRIPYELGYFEYLNSLNASYNKLTGAIPTSVGNLTRLTSLDLAKNQLSGTIPKQLGSLEFLTFLNVSYNQLVGMIPKGRQLRKLTEASFVGNKGLCGAPLKYKC